MQNLECFDDDVADLKTVSRGEKTAIQFRLHLRFDGLLRGPIAIDRHAQLLTDYGQALDMIRAFVRDEDARQIFRRAAHRG